MQDDRMPSACGVLKSGTIHKPAGGVVDYAFQLITLVIVSKREDYRAESDLSKMIIKLTCCSARHEGHNNSVNRLTKHFITRNKPGG